MKVPMQWLRQYADVPVSAAEYEEQMIMHGTGVEGIEDLAQQVQNVVVGRVLSIAKHENSDHMVICQVDVGDEVLQIVTGAPNVFEGALVPVAKCGAVLPGGKRIQKGKLRGVDSYGMLCSGPELNVPVDLYPSVGDEGILIFREDYPLGADVRPILGIDDQIVDFEILANRPDCQCVWGVARETAVTLGTAFRKPEISVRGVPGQMKDFVHIDVRDTDLCPRYVARVVKNVRIAPSPMWLRRALHGCGVRSINNIVDITNYVMLETGHPMHAFDLAKVRNGHIVVRRANEGETIVTLDGKERALSTEMLVIADQEHATGIAGVMGGEESEITDGTQTVMFESAAFDHANIRVTSRTLGLRTESSGRFEKGVCAATAREAIDRACQLVEMLQAGDVIEDVVDVYPNPAPIRVIEASVQRICRRISVDVPGETMKQILESLSFGVELNGDALRVTVPCFREDVEREADISEEVLRIYGFEHLGSTLLRGETTPGKRSAHMRLTDKVGRILTGMGMYEIKNFSFVSPKLLDQLRLSADDARRHQMRLLNPLGEDTSVMRSTLAPSMLQTLSLNQSRGNDQGMLFEIAPVFDADARTPDGLPDEHQMLCIGAYGPQMDFYTVRDAALELLRQFGIACEIAPAAEPYHHPGRAATLCASETVVARVGEVHPDVLESFGLSRRALVAEIDLRAVEKLKSPMGEVKPLPRFPAVTRDLALVMDESVPVGTVLASIRKAGGALLESAELFDVYRGAQMLAGKKSVAFSLAFRSPERTLVDEDVNAVMKEILSTCEREYGAQIRA